MIYDPGIRTQFGATTMVEQQDGWLVQLDAPPVVDDAYYAGWDATGGTFIGGFTPHHARGTSRQFIGWYGQASYNVVPASELGVQFDSTVWVTVNAIGSGGGGASGSGLFDDTGRLQGVLVRGHEQPGEGRFGVCPAPSPPTPSLTSATAWSTALSGIFNSTADPRSTTGTTTLQSVLDPDYTGTRVLSGQAAPPVVSFTNNSGWTPFTGQTITLTWSASRAQSCTASGGEAGDGWSGSVTMSGSRIVTSYNGGTVTYLLTCSNGSLINVSRVKVTWTLSSPTVWISAQHLPAVYNTPFELQWQASVRPCMADGGHAGDGWSGTQATRGTMAVVANVVGQVTYRLVCGEGSRTATSSITVDVLPPRAAVTADASTLRVGEFVRLTTSSAGPPCTLSGGAAGDGWAGNATYNGTVDVTETAAGTYTYALSCGSGAQAATSQVAVTFVDAAPNVSLTASATEVSWMTTAVAFNWDSNVRPCLLSVSGPQTMTFDFAPRSPRGTYNHWPDALGDYVYTVTCGSGATTAHASVAVSVLGTPYLKLSYGPFTATAGQMFLVQYQSNLAPCTLSGGVAGDGWAGVVPNRNGNRNVMEATDGTYMYSATCGFGALTRTEQTTVTVLPKPPDASPSQPVPAPPLPASVRISASAGAVTVGDSVTLSWTTANVDSCTGSGGTLNDGWTGSVASNGGTRRIQESVSGAYTYAIACTGAGGATRATASVIVNVNAPIVTVETSSGGAADKNQSGGGGGGGALGRTELVMLGALVALSWALGWRRRRAQVIR